tara:strand:- start:484 stop:783 length:300 start_codon:yes stop_codon:yes gene_type:complete
MRKLRPTEVEQLEELLALGGAVDARLWQSGHAKWKFKRRTPLFAQVYLRSRLEFLPSGEAVPDHVLAVFSEDPTTKAVIGISNLSGARDALVKYRKEIA